MTMGIKISLKKNVHDAELEECSVDTRYSSPKVGVNKHKVSGRNGISNVSDSGYNVGVVEYKFPDNPAQGTYNLITLEHGCPSTPNPIVYVSKSPFTAFQILPITINFFYDPAQGIYCYATPTALKIDYVRGANIIFPSPVDVTGFHYKFKYYIFVDEGG